MMIENTRNLCTTLSKFPTGYKCPMAELARNFENHLLFIISSLPINSLGLVSNK